MVKPLVASVVALAMVGMSSARAAVPAELATAVAALPESQTPEKLKKAMLTWAVEEADALDAAGQTQAALALVADIRVALTQNLGVARPAPENLIPPIPHLDRNPWAQAAFKSLARVIATDTKYPKGPAGDVTRDATGWRFIKITEDARSLMLALGHPQSPYRDDPRLVAPLLRRLSTTLEYCTPGHKRLADFGFSDNIAEVYLLLRTVHPDLILPSLKAAWEKGIAVNSEAVLARVSKRFTAAAPGTTYPNADLRLMNALMFGSLVLDRPDLRAMADAGLQFHVRHALFSDGGMTYINTQNECLTYHGINIVALARFEQVTGDRAARDLIAATRWYYPLSIEPSGVAEYSTSPSWKAYWNMVTGNDAALIVAAITGCPHNARVAAMGDAGRGNLLLAPYFRPELTPAAAPDGYITYDQNTLGPRGRFGRFSFAGTTREVPDARRGGAFDPSTEFRGRSTYVGCMVMYPEGKIPKGQERWPLSAALQDATVEVRVAPGVPDLSRLNTHAFLSKDDRNATTVNDRFAALTTSYTIVDRKGELTPWRVEQVWLMTPRRIVGLVEVSATADAEALGVNGHFRFISGRVNWGTRKEFESVTSDTLRYGDLETKLHAQTFGAVSTDYTDTFSGDTKKTGLLLLGAPQGDLSPQRFAKGTRKFYLAEVRPVGTEPAGEVRRFDAGPGLIGVLLADGDLKLRAVFNTTDAPVTYKIERADGQMLHRSGERHRADWLPPIGATSDTPASPVVPTRLRGDSAEVVIPALSHVVIREP